MGGYLQIIHFVDLVDPWDLTGRLEKWWEKMVGLWWDFTGELMKWWDYDGIIDPQTPRNLMKFCSFESSSLNGIMMGFYWWNPFEGWIDETENLPETTVYGHLGGWDAPLAW